MSFRYTNPFLSAHGKLFCLAMHAGAPLDIKLSTANRHAFPAAHSLLGAQNR
jgi:hypothetical protein